MNFNSKEKAITQLDYTTPIHNLFTQLFDHLPKSLKCLKKRPGLSNNNTYTTYIHNSSNTPPCNQLALFGRRGLVLLVQSRYIMDSFFTKSKLLSNQFGRSEVLTLHE